MMGQENRSVGGDFQRATVCRLRHVDAERDGGRGGGAEGVKLTAGVARGADCEPSKLPCAAAVTDAEGLESSSLDGSSSAGQMLRLGALHGDRPLLTLISM